VRGEGKRGNNQKNGSGCSPDEVAGRQSETKSLRNDARSNGKGKEKRNSRSLKGDAMKDMRSASGGAGRPVSQGEKISNGSLWGKRRVLSADRGQRQKKEMGARRKVVAGD